jgi:hypothetical protein
MFIMLTVNILMVKVATGVITENQRSAILSELGKLLDLPYL